MHRKSRTERFVKQSVSYRFRDSRTGRVVSEYTTRGTKRKNVRKEKILNLYTADKKTGEIRKYGSIVEPSRQRLAETETKGRNIYLKGVFRRAAIWEKAVKKKATGVLITIRAKGRKTKDTAIRVKVVFDDKKSNDPNYMQTVALAKVMRALAERELRLSDLQITSHKKYFQLKDVKVLVDYYSGDAGEDTDGEEEADNDDIAGGDQWEEESSTSEPKKRKKRKGKRKRNPRRGSSRSTRRTTRKGKSR